MKALDKCFDETGKHAKKIDREAVKHESKQEAKQVAKASSLLKAAGKRTSLELAPLMESPFSFLASDGKPR